MLHFCIQGLLVGATLLLAAGGGAEAQGTPGHAVLRPIDDYARVAGRIRELNCRGKPGIDLRVEQDPSPRVADQVAMVLRYERPAGQFVPGSCSWNLGGFPDIPPEPGVVHFDLARDGQPWASPGARDTSIESAEHYPDVASLPRFLSDSSRYWVFFVDEASNVAISHGRWPLGGAAPPIADPPAPAPATAFGKPRQSGATSGAADRPQMSDATGLLRTEELRCRGGAGLDFIRGARAGTNQVVMTLGYTVSPKVPGETGRGLAPGSCAWVDRTGLPAEGGKIRFITAGNAQLRQAQSGSTVDRSPTAAERWPDAHTIPVYLSDPSRFWRFSVVMVDADSARQHGPWKPSLADAIAGPVADATPTRSVPRTPAVGDQAVDSAESSVAFDPFAVRGIVVTPSVNGVAMKFEGPTVIPLVQVSTSPPFQEPRTGRWMFSPEHVSLSVARDAAAGPHAYSAATTATLRQNTEYHYVINAPKPSGTASTLNLRRREGGDRQAVGTFRTLRTTVTVRIDRLRLINDSDDDSNGELAFTFSVNGTRMLEAGTGSADVSQGSLLDLADGATYDFSRDIPAGEVRNHLRIHAAGFDNDGVTPGSYDTSWNATPGGNSGGDWNHARAEFSLDRYPGRSFDFPFRMRTGPGSRLQFEVVGRVVVTRE